MRILYFFSFLFLSYHLFCDESFVLFTTLYNEKKELRQNEFMFCLEKNLHHPSIKKIVILYESKEKQDFLKKLKDLEDFEKKVEVIFIDERPTFEQFFNLANIFYRDEKIIIANADIHFDNTLDLIYKKQLKNKLIALTRYDRNENGQYQLHDNHCFVTPCQDSWIFHAPIKSFFCNFKLGILGCDPALAYAALKAKLQVVNPSRTIKTYHVHSSNIRTYTSSDNYDQIFPFASLRLVEWKQ